MLPPSGGAERVDDGEHALDVDADGHAHRTDPKRKRMKNSAAEEARNRREGTIWINAPVEMEKKRALFLDGTSLNPFLEMWASY